MRVLLCCLVVLVMAGCASVKYTAFDGEVRQATASVDVYSTAERVERPYKEIGLITADKAGSDKDEADLLKLAIEKARGIGADGIILQATETTTDHYTRVGIILMESSKHVVRVLAIKYTDR